MQAIGHPVLVASAHEKRTVAPMRVSAVHRSQAEASRQWWTERVRAQAST